MIIGLNGDIGCGKTLCEHLLQIIGDDKGYNVYSYAFADTLKEICSILTHQNIQYFYTREGKEKFIGSIPKTFSEKDIYFDNLPFVDALSKRFYNEHTGFLDIHMTNGELLQTVGSIGRNINENIWIDFLKEKIEYEVDEQNKDGKLDLFIFTDVRHPNEYAFVKGIGGIILWIDRGENEIEKGIGKGKRDLKHESEISLLSLRPYMVHIENKGTVNDLNEKLKFIFP